jgi:UDP-2,3-diacylglucosamine pyrophosphatase LpxH
LRFRFIHAADLHLGSPFRGLATKDATVAQRFAEAIRTAFSNLVDQAIELSVDFVVIAGDVYDGEWRDNAIGLFFNRQIARLDRAGIPVFVLKGNHDADSVVTKSVTLPASVKQFATRSPSTERLDALKVALHGQGFTDRATTDNLALGYPPPVPGWFNIGVLHTSLTGRPPHANYSPCSAQELIGRGYDYWALGHVHEFEIVARDPAIVFPGNLQGRSVRETGPRGAVLVTVVDNQVTAIDRLIVDDARWHEFAIDLTGLDTLPDLWRSVEAALAPVVDAAEGRPIAARVRLTGASPLVPWLLANRVNASDEVQAAGHRASAEFWLEKLELRLQPAATPIHAAGPLDIGALIGDAAADPELAALAQQLIGEVSARLPAGLGAQGGAVGDDLGQLLAEARALVQQRIAGGS